MPTKTVAGGTFRLADGLTVTRMGYGAMQLAGPHVFGPPADRDAAIAVLREAVELGHHPHRHQRLLRPARHQRDHQGGAAPLPRVAAPRDQGGRPARRRGRLATRRSLPDQLRQAVHDNLDHLGLDALDVVNLRVGGFDSPAPGSIAEPFTALAQLQQEGLIKHLGLSKVDRRADRRGAGHRARSCACRTSTTSPTGTTTT